MKEIKLNRRNKNKIVGICGLQRLVHIDCSLISSFERVVLSTLVVSTIESVPLRSINVDKSFIRERESNLGIEFDVRGNRSSYVEKHLRIVQSLGFQAWGSSFVSVPHPPIIASIATTPPMAAPAIVPTWQEEEAATHARCQHGMGELCESTESRYEL